MRKNNTGSRAKVMHGLKAKTSTRLTKQDLLKNKKGYIVSKRQHEAGKKRAQNKGFQTWNTACKLAKEKLNLQGFILIKKETEVYRLAKILQKDLKQNLKSLL